MCAYILLFTYMFIMHSWHTPYLEQMFEIKIRPVYVRQAPLRMSLLSPCETPESTRDDKHLRIHTNDERQIFLGSKIFIR